MRASKHVFYRFLYLAAAVAKLFVEKKSDLQEPRKAEGTNIFRCTHTRLSFIPQTCFFWAWQNPGDAMKMEGSEWIGTEQKGYQKKKTWENRIKLSSHLLSLSL